jgi:hypothetical protein
MSSAQPTCKFISFSTFVLIVRFANSAGLYVLSVSRDSIPLLGLQLIHVTLNRMSGDAFRLSFDLGAGP